MTKANFIKQNIFHFTFFLFVLIGVGIKTDSNLDLALSLDLAQSRIVTPYVIIPPIMLGIGLVLSIYKRSLVLLMLPTLGAFVFAMYLPKLIDLL